MVKLSVIVPVYNVEKHLKRCIDSIIKQTYKDFELILVDDGSTDNSPKICDEFCKQDKRIKVIHKENGGVSSARNAGLDIAEGDYISFIDSDDYIEVDMFKKLIQRIIENSADIAQCNFKVVCENEKGLKNKVYKEVKVADRYSALNESVDVPFSNVVWNKIYKKEILSGIKFNENIKRFEDVDFTYRVLLNCSRYVKDKSQLYNYFQRQGSLCRANKYSLELLEAIYTQNERINMFEEKEVPKYILKKAYERYFNDIIRHYNLIKINIDDYEKNNGYEILESLIKERINSKFISELDIKIRIELKLIVLNRNIYFMLKEVNDFINYFKNGIKYRIRKFTQINDLF